MFRSRYEIVLKGIEENIIYDRQHRTASESSICALWISQIAMSIQVRTSAKTANPHVFVFFVNCALAHMGKHIFLAILYFFVGFG